MGDLDKNPHVKPDWENVEFALFMGTSPAQSGNPFKRQARQLASARLRENFQYVVVAPALPYQRCSPILAVAGNRSCRQRFGDGNGDDPLDHG
ncbi:tetrathionate reductase subunit A [Salmonella enterica subsp. enterica]|uniref:Tetrathionate reductase subunit A n=1 Tax=Salmonella enterica I TaxID=59201 RepID=A0A379WUK0_SALET|nr:tetrathionate reductase subunit A [Salmonella enterica subsp. enterica]